MMKTDNIIISVILGIGLGLIYGEVKKARIGITRTTTNINKLLIKIEENSTVGKLVGTSELHDELVDLVKDVKQNPRRYVNVEVSMFGKKK